MPSNTGSKRDGDMNSKYETIIQNLGIEGLAAVLDIIAEWSQAGSVTPIAVGDLQGDVHKRLKIARNRVSTLVECFAEAGVFSYDQDNRQIHITNDFPWGYEQQAERRETLIWKLQAADMIEASEDTQPTRPSSIDDGISATLPYAEPETASYVEPTEPVFGETPFEENHDMGSPVDLPDADSQGEFVQTSSPRSDQAVNRQYEYPANEPDMGVPSPPPPPARSNYGRGRAIPPAMGDALSAEEMLKQAGIAGESTGGTNNPPPSPPQGSGTPSGSQPPTPAPTSVEQPPPGRPQWGSGSRMQPPAAQNPTSQPPPTPANNVGGRANRLRPGAAPPPQEMPTAPKRDLRRPGADTTPSSTPPAWASRRGASPYGTQPVQPTPSSDDQTNISDELLRLLRDQQSGKPDLSLDIRTLRALSEEINRYIQGLEQAQLADDPNLRVELQSLLDQINRRAQKKDDSSDA